MILLVYDIILSNSLTIGIGKWLRRSLNSTSFCVFHKIPQKSILPNQAHSTPPTAVDSSVTHFIELIGLF